MLTVNDQTNMKKLLFILFLFPCMAQSQMKLYAIKGNVDGTRDSFYVSANYCNGVYSSTGQYVMPCVDSMAAIYGFIMPNSLGSFIKCADGIYRNSVPMISNIVLTSGTYTPTLTSVSNIQASTAFTCAWIRVGDLVTVTGQVSIDCTTASSTSTEIGISLPVVSNLIADASLAGTAVSDQVASLSARVKADAANDRARIVFKAISATNDTYSFTFTYLVQ